MHWIAKLILITIGNAFALWIANLYIPGFVVSTNLVVLLALALVLAVLNFFLKPILTLVLGPVIILTLGLGVLVVNGLILWLLTVVATHLAFLQGSITIQTIPALVLGTLVVSIVNFVIHMAL
jgi:putative membrane protein